MVAAAPAAGWKREGGMLAVCVRVSCVRHFGMFSWKTAASSATRSSAFEAGVCACADAARHTAMSTRRLTRSYCMSRLLFHGVAEGNGSFTRVLLVIAEIDSVT